MANRVGQRLNRAKKLLLASTGVAAVVGPLILGIGHSPAINGQSRTTSAPSPVGAYQAEAEISVASVDATPQTASSPAPVQAVPVQTPTPQQGSGAPSTEKALAFDVASIKPYSGGGGGRNGGAGGGPPLARGGGGLRFMPGRVVSAPIGVTARKIILEAFHLTQYQLSGGAPDWLDSDRFDLEAKAEGANENQLRQMLQTLLVERFKLVVHREGKEMPVYNLVLGKNGTKLHEWKEGDPMPGFGSDGRPKFIDRGTMQRLADVLSGGPNVGRPVLDKTGLPGVYVFYVEWDEGEEFLPAMQQQLGLKLEPQKGPVDCITIDRIEKPDAN